MKLNREQELAARPDPGITLVIAGAGTGKTSALIEKAKNLIAGGAVAPENMLILTFSRKAADEIGERLVARVGTAAEGVVSGTFHSFCFRLIREHRAGGRAPGIIDQEEADRVIDTLIRARLDEFRGLPVPLVRQLLPGGPRKVRDTEEKLEALGLRRAIDDLHVEYRRYKAAGNLMDFGDLMEEAIGILERDTAFRDLTAQRYRYLLVDEFQDTSEDNFRLLKLLLPGGRPNLFAVGDDWQSIYGFRNARVEYLVNMKKYFSGVRTIVLRTNYRSRREIVDISSRFISKNRFRTSKKLVSHAGPGGSVRAFTVASRQAETDLIAGLLAGFVSDTAVLYRNNWQGEYIKEKLGRVCGDAGPRFMTMHASKGLEFGTVIIAGVSDRVIPDRSSDLEEERRLFYVALTRAKRNLFLVYHADEKGELPLFARELGVRPVPFSGAF